MCIRDRYEVDATGMEAATVGSFDYYSEALGQSYSLTCLLYTSMLIMTNEGIYAARDRYGRTPLMVGKKEDAYCVSFESFAYMSMGLSLIHIRCV